LFTANVIVRTPKVTPGVRTTRALIEGALDYNHAVPNGG
jgi:hypothetical protein